MYLGKSCISLTLDRVESKASMLNARLKGRIEIATRHKAILCFVELSRSHSRPPELDSGSGRGTSPWILDLTNPICRI